MICTSHRHGTPDALFLSHVIFLAKSIHDTVELAGALAAFAGVTGIDGTLYEAARIDGATKRNEIRYITLPLLAPTITVMTTVEMK